MGFLRAIFNPLPRPKKQDPEKARSRKETGLDLDERVMHLPTKTVREKLHRAVGKAATNVGAEYSSGLRALPQAMSAAGHASVGIVEGISATRAAVNTADAANSARKAVKQAPRIYLLNDELETRNEPANIDTKAQFQNFKRGFLSSPSKPVRQADRTLGNTQKTVGMMERLSKNTDSSASSYDTSAHYVTDYPSYFPDSY